MRGRGAPAPALSTSQVDEYYRVLGRSGYIAILDTPNRAFPLETHSIGLPLIRWLPPLAHGNVEVYISRISR